MLYPGQGAQYPGMARDLYLYEPVFRRSFDHCATCCDLPLGRLIFDDERATLDRTEITQPAIFGVEYALTEMLRARGLEPDLVLGHSVGEYAAACAAGMLTVEEAGAAVATRGRLMSQHCEPGALLAVVAHEPDLELLLCEHPDVEVALRNATNHVVIGGPHGAVEQFRTVATRAGLPARMLSVSHAFHTRMMEPMLDHFSETIAHLRGRQPKTAFISSVTGGGLTHVDADYWVDHVRQPVRFAEALRSLRIHAPTVVLEVGPGRTLIGLAKHEVGRGAARRWLPLLYPGADDHAAVMSAITAAAHECQVR
jgi:acyl transferase domain-containing protein